MTKNYLWTDNPTEANVAVYDPDILNECLMHLKYTDTKLTNFCINSASVDSNGNPNLLSYTGNTVKFNCGNALHPIMTSNSQDGWTLSGSHQITSSSNDLYKSFDNTSSTYCVLNHMPTLEEPAYIKVEKSTAFSFDYLFIKFKSTINFGDIKSFNITDENDDILYSYDNYDDYLHKNEFLIPVYNFNSTHLKLIVTSNVNDATYTNFPCIIKLLDKTQILTLTNIKGNIGNLINVNDCTIPSASNQTYNIFADTEGNAEIFNTPLTKSTLLPTTPTTNHIHLLTSLEPLQAKKYNGTKWEDYNKIPVGYAKTNASGAVYEVKTFPYSQNGYNINANTSGTLTKCWMSPAYNFALNTRIVANHNLNLENPQKALCSVMLYCAEANNGYAVGEYATCWAFQTPTNVGNEAKPEILQNTLSLAIGNNILGNYKTAGLGGSSLSFSPNYWQLVFKIYY